MKKSHFQRLENRLRSLDDYVRVPALTYSMNLLVRRSHLTGEQSKKLTKDVHRALRKPFAASTTFIRDHEFRDALEGVAFSENNRGQQKRFCDDVYALSYSDNADARFCAFGVMDVFTDEDLGFYTNKATTPEQKQIFKERLNMASPQICMQLLNSEISIELGRNNFTSFNNQVTPQIAEDTLVHVFADNNFARKQGVIDNLMNLSEVLRQRAKDRHSQPYDGNFVTVSRRIGEEAKRTVVIHPPGYPELAVVASSFYHGPISSHHYPNRNMGHWIENSYGIAKGTETEKAQYYKDYTDLLNTSLQKCDSAYRV